MLWRCSSVVTMNMNIVETVNNCRVLPVVVCDDEERSVTLAKVLQRAGMPVIELTLRTENALACIKAIKEAVPELLIAAGTVTNASALSRAVNAGADFVVSPGISTEIIRAASARDLFLIPGVATASEIMLGMASGLTLFKLFPAEAIGGTALVKSLAGPFPGIRFCPTGGLNAVNYQDYLALDNVACVGGSWMVKADMIENGQWEEIERLARAAIRTQKHVRAN